MTKLVFISGLLIRSFLFVFQEAVSEVLHRPLYRVSMGELGTTPESLEARLQEIFDLCLPWQALVLIDEAEMLLEKRSHSGTE